MGIMELAVQSGIVGVLVAFIYFLVHQMRADRKFMEDRLTKIIESDQECRERYTTVLTELITYLKIRNGGK